METPDDSLLKLAEDIFFDVAAFEAFRKTTYASKKYLLSIIENMNKDILRKFLVGEDEAKLDKYCLPTTNEPSFNAPYNGKGVVIMKKGQRISSAPVFRYTSSKTPISILRETRNHEIVALGVSNVKKIAQHILPSSERDPYYISDEKLQKLIKEQQSINNIIARQGRPSFHDRKLYIELPDGRLLNVLKMIIHYKSPANAPKVPIDSFITTLDEIVKNPKLGYALASNEVVKKEVVSPNIDIDDDLADLPEHLLNNEIPDLENNIKNNKHMKRVKRFDTPPKSDDEIFREIEYERIIMGDADVSKDYFPMLALGVYFDKINYQRNTNKKRIPYAELINIIKDMNEHVLVKYLVSNDSANIKTYLEKRAKGEDYLEPKEDVIPTIVPEEKTEEIVFQKPDVITNKATLRRNIAAELHKLGVDTPSFALKIIPAGRHDASYITDAKLTDLDIHQKHFLRCLNDGGAFKPHGSYYKPLKDKKYLDTVAIIKAYRGLEGKDNIKQFAAIDINQFVFTEEQIRAKISQTIDSPEMLQQDTVLSLSERRHNELCILGIRKNKIFQIFPCDNNGRSLISDAKLKELEETRLNTIQTLSQGGYIPQSILSKVNNGKWLDIIKMRKAHQDVEAAAKMDIEEFLFTTEELIAQLPAKDDVIQEKPEVLTEGVTLKCSPSDDDYKLLANIFSRTDNCLFKVKVKDGKRYVKIKCIANKENLQTINSIYERCQGNRKLIIKEK